MNFRNRKLVRAVQIILGILLIYFPLSGFLPAIAVLSAPHYNEKATAFSMALFSTGYMFPFMLLIFVITGLMFILNKWPAFAAALLAPITANILLFHIFLDFTGFGPALIIIILHAYLLAVHWPHYKHMFSK